MKELPSGTVSLLFTDVEGSTRLLQALGDRYVDVLADHHRLLREAVAAHGGVEVATDGDAFFVAFSQAADAVAAAARAQTALAAHEWPDGQEVRVRMGIHTGTPLLGGENYVGLDVHKAARVMAAGHGGQVLISAATRERLEGDFPLLDLGEHRLKDLLQPERLYQLRVAGLPDEFPALKTLGNRPTNLPVQPNPLLGRERELERLCDLVRDERTRLVTLTGPGGTGKTRLALQAGAELLDSFPSGVFFVPLATVRDPALVVSAAAQALALRERPGEDLLETLGAYLEDKQMLLLLDNLEQVLPAAGALAELLRRSPGSKLVATSRSPLRISAEREFPVPPLALPDLRRPSEELAQSESVALFLERARAVKPELRLDGDTLPAVASICVRLDGLPLAIELAAARVRILSPSGLLERLEKCLPLLTGGARDQEERQRTLRAAIDWSYDLLSEAEQRLFATMAVFSGGWTLEAAAAVSAAARGPATDPLEGLESLVEKSLVRHEQGHRGEPRFSMLGTIREYALERLDERADAGALRSAHAEHFLGLAETAAAELYGPEQVEWLDVLEAEHDNFRAALNWSLADGGGAALGLRLAAALGRFWYVRAHVVEGAAWLERALAAEPHAPPAERAKALHHLGVLCDERGDLERAALVLEESLALGRVAGDRRALAATLNSLGIVARNEGDSARARRLLTESLELKRELGEVSGISTTICCLGVIAVDDGELEQARALFEESLELDRGRGDRNGVAINLGNLGTVALEQGDLERARTLLADGLRAFRELGDPEGVAECLEQIASLGALRGHAERAARLAGAADALREARGMPLASVDRARLDRYLAAARATLGDDAFADRFADGGRLELDESVRQALAEAAESS